MTDTWPPSAETLEKMAVRVDQRDGFQEGCAPPVDDILAFLREPRLREALELAEAVAWCLENDVSLEPDAWAGSDYYYDPDVPCWTARKFTIKGYITEAASTIPEAVRVLRQEIEKEGASS